MTEHVLRPEVAGGWGPDTQADTTLHPPVVHRLHYEFQGWLGDDIVESFPCFLVTRRLAEAIEREALTGAEFAQVKVTKDPQFVRFYPQVADSLPDWLWLKPAGEPHVSDFWLLPNANLVVSGRALGVMRRFALQHCDVKILELT